MLEKDYRKLYQTQYKVLYALKSDLASFYLTGGTALGRFYLNHRFSEDLDFFLNKSDDFHSSVKNIEKILLRKFSVLHQQSIVYDDFVRYYIEDEDSVLKLEFVNDIAYRCGIPKKYEFGLIDTPLNILTNKLTALISRDEPKDVYDIYALSKHYMFNWLDVFEETKNKAIINEIDVEQRITSFPTILFQTVNWHILPIDIESISKEIKKIADDFFLGSYNSLGTNKLAIEDAEVINL